MPRPTQTPIGLALARTAKEVSAAFDRSLVEAGGSLPTWLVLMAVKSHPQASQREIAATVGIQGATLTHHLNRLESEGLLTRRRDPENRRLHIVELTLAGERMFDTLREAAVGHDLRLRRSISSEDVDRLAALLRQLRENVAPATEQD